LQESLLALIEEAKEVLIYLCIRINLEAFFFTCKQLIFAFQFFNILSGVYDLHPAHSFDQMLLVNFYRIKLKLK